MNEQNILKVTRLALNDDGGVVKTAKDGRKYVTAYFQPMPQGGILSNARARGRNIWQEGPNGSQGDAIFPHLANAPVDENGFLQKPLKVVGDVQSIEVEEYYIPNEYGKDSHPATGEPCNKADRYTSVVFEDETIAQLARAQDHTLAGEEEFQALEEDETISEEEVVA